MLYSPGMRGEDEATAQRRAERERLIALRLGASPDERRRWSEMIAQKLVLLLLALPGRTIGLYSPVKGEFDPLPLAGHLIDAGRITALPAVVERRGILEYRRWEPQAEMEDGAHGIPAPKARQIVRPDILVVPLVGFDDRKFRLGYGGGYFDRTIAALAPRPVTVGVGFESAHVATILPHPHDIALDHIVTEARG
jgi:5-formyltetrahydrofolate cyclo-ligase